MKFNSSVSLLAAAVLTMLAGNVNAQILPVSLVNSGFTGDAILAGGSDGITIDVSGNPNTNPGASTYEYASTAYATQVGGFVGTELPDNGTIHSGTGSGATFQLQPYTGPNLLVVQGTSKTLTLTTPTRFTDVSILLNQPGNSSSATTFTLNFTSGSPLIVTTTQNVPFWVGAGPVSNPPNESAGIAVTNNALAINNGQDGTPINFLEYDFALSSPDKFRLLSSITVDGGSQNLDVFAVSGVVGVAPEPSTWAMMIGGVGALFIVGRMRRKQNA